jgi:hypothetical protein
MLKLSYGLKIDVSGRLRKVRIHRGLFIVGCGSLMVARDEIDAECIMNRLTYRGDRELSFD